MTIPKIIHHIAPKDISRWHPIWNRCYPSWKEHFSDFEHKLWEDGEEINNFVKEHYPQYYDMFMDFPAHIMRVDFVRFCILHHYGGIYSDMDMFCYKNFYDELSHPLHIIEAPYGEEFLESSLMMSEPAHEFWTDCMELSKEVFYTTIKKYEIKIPFNNNRAHQYLLQSGCGPNLICRVWRKWVKTKPNFLQTLPGILYNNHGMSYHPEYRTKHLMTGMWGKESMDYIEQVSDESKSLQQILDEGYVNEMKKYVKLNNVSSVNDFDFYFDYTNGGMKTHFIPDLDAGDIDNKPTGKIFNYD
jgi:mannosyltransferase OCH1-like enzyme